MADIPRALIVGCGYVGQRLARTLNADHVLYGIVRSATHADALRALEVEPIVVDLDAVTHRDLSPAWYRGSAIFYFAPPQQTGESDTRLHRFLDALTEQPSALIYISTTGVYGDLRGAMADESTPLNPSTPRARRRASAEEISRVWCHEHSVRRVVLRVPAIYGPGRLPLDRLRSGEPAVIESEAPIINRIHVDDLVSACVAAYHNENARGVYNVSDGNDLTMTAYLKRVAEHAQLPMPSQITLEHAHVTLNSQMLSYLDESRRISNARMLNELGVELRYADVDEGIRRSLEEVLHTESRNER
jgi:nucleoside-diphosphate-sugar epimerase